MCESGGIGSCICRKMKKRDARRQDRPHTLHALCARALYTRSVHTLYTHICSTRSPKRSLHALHTPGTCVAAPCCTVFTKGATRYGPTARCQGGRFRMSSVKMPPGWQHTASTGSPACRTLNSRACRTLHLRKRGCVVCVQTVVCSYGALVISVDDIACRLVHTGHSQTWSNTAYSFVRPYVTHGL